MKNRLNWNWGKGIVMVYVLFVAGMLYLVFQSKQQKLDLVVDDYYQQELKFQGQIDATQRAIDAGAKPVILEKDGAYMLQIPGASGEAVSGTLLAYCAADKNKDQKMDLHQTNSGQWVLPLSGLATGKYVFKVQWKQHEEAYYAELNFDK